MLSAAPRSHRTIRTRSLAILGAMVVVAIVSQVATRVTPTSSAVRPTIVDPQEPAIGDLDAGAISFGSSDGASTGALVGSPRTDVARIRADIDFWGRRVALDPDDFISSNRLGTSQIELARSTGDLSAYLAAESAFDTTLRRDPTNAAASGYRGSVLVSLHRFTEAAAQAQVVLARRPDDPVALATLGDAELELGNVDAARTAYVHAHRVAPSAATLGRLGHLAFITGDTTAAVRDTRAAVAASVAEGAEGERAAFYQYQLADALISMGDRRGAAKAYAAALAADPGSFLARSGLARVAAADGDLDAAIRQLSDAISIVPQPEFLARRGDLFTLRGRPGDAKLAAADLATVEAIAKLSGEAANVYDRTLALYLANHGLEPDRAVSLAESELAIRKDVYGYDAMAWALLADGRAADADAAMRSAIAFGTVDAKVLYHAGMIDLALGRADEGRAALQRSLDLDSSFDPLQAARARTALASLPPG